MKFISDLSSDNIKGLVWSLALPSMLSQLVSVLYSIVDRMYIGNIPGYGETALAGVGVCGPIITLISSFAFLVGIGGSPLVSIKLGEGRVRDAKKIVANCFVFLLVLAVIVTILAFLFRRPILITFGASEALYPYAESYFSVYLLGTVFALVATGMNQFIITQGYSRNGMLSVVIGAVTNIILDPIFIFILDMGVTGAAVATVFSQIASCAYVLWFLFRGSALVPITFGGYDLKIIGRVTVIGMSSFLIILFDNVMLISLNMMLQKHGGAGYGDMLLTCNTIVQSFELLITMPLGGLTMGTQTILGYNFGARRPDKILRAQRMIFAIAVGFCALMFLAAQIIPHLFARIFTQDPEYIDMTARLIRIYTLGTIPLAIQYEIVDGFTGLGMVKIALPLSVFRKIVFFSCVFILPVFFPIENIFWCEAISDILPPIVSLTVYLLTIKRVIRREPPPAKPAA